MTQGTPVPPASDSSSLQRIAIGIEYDGTAYCGWQDQPHAPSVQASLNAAISHVAATPLTCIGAGRTDSGVHASGQVAHFDTPAHRESDKWRLGLNSQLPADISINWAEQVADGFHARFSAVSRSYHYLILNRRVRSALQRDRCWWVYRLLDVDLMQQAAKCLLGKHDFSAFRASACQSHSPVRTMSQLDISREGDWVHIKCSANAFLHHMVRNIVGSLVRVGGAEEGVTWIAELLADRDRKKSGITAPPQGLTLTRVDYPAEMLRGS